MLGRISCVVYQMQNNRTGNRDQGVEIQCLRDCFMLGVSIHPVRYCNASDWSASRYSCPMD